MGGRGYGGGGGGGEGAETSDDEQTVIHPLNDRSGAGGGRGGRRQRNHRNGKRRPDFQKRTEKNVLQLKMKPRDERRIQSVIATPLPFLLLTLSL